MELCGEVREAVKSPFWIPGLMSHLVILEGPSDQHGVHLCHLQYPHHHKQHVHTVGSMPARTRLKKVRSVTSLPITNNTAMVKKNSETRKMANEFKSPGYIKNTHATPNISKSWKWRQCRDTEEGREEEERREHEFESNTLLAWKRRQKVEWREKCVWWNVWDERLHVSAPPPLNSNQNVGGWGDGNTIHSYSAHQTEKLHRSSSSSFWPNIHAPLVPYHA